MDPEPGSSGQPSDRSNDSDVRTTLRGAVDRRTFVKGAGVAAAAAGGFALGSPAGAQAEYGQTLDVVDDLGADPTGEEPINDALAEGVADVEYDVGGMGDIAGLEQDDDGVEIVFPEGEYVLDAGPGGDGFARWAFGGGDEQKHLGKVALVGEGDVTLRIPEGERHNALTLWGRELTVENFRIDHTLEDTSTGITAVAEDDLRVADLHFDGKVTGPYVEVDGPNDEEGVPDDPNCLIPGLLNEDGTGVVEDVRAPDGVESLSRKGAVWVNFVHAGDLLFRRCEFSHFADNAIYGSPPGGSNGAGGAVRVEDCYFRNNNVTAIRLGTPGSYAKNCTVITEQGEIPATPWGAITSRAGWVWYNFDGYYENVDVIHDHPNGVGIIDHGDNTRDLSLSVRNCRFALNNGADGISVTDPGVEALTLENVSLTGDTAGGPVVSVDNADVDVTNLCISQSGSNRDGVALGSVDATITDAVIDVQGEAITVGPDTVLRATNVSEADHDCVGPDPDHEFGSDPAEFSAVPDDLDGQDFTRTPTPTPSPTSSPTASPTATPTSSPTPTATTAPGTGSPGGDPTDTTSPGLTSLAALGALGAASLAALRRSNDED